MPVQRAKRMVASTSRAGKMSTINKTTKRMQSPRRRRRCSRCNGRLRGGPSGSSVDTRSAAQSTAQLPDEPAANPATPGSILILTTLPERAAARGVGARVARHPARRVHPDRCDGAVTLSLARPNRNGGRNPDHHQDAGAGLYPLVEEAIRRHHPYELPEIVAVPISCGLPAYLDWIAAETDAPA